MNFVAIFCFVFFVSSVCCLFSHLDIVVVVSSSSKIYKMFVSCASSIWFVCTWKSEVFTSRELEHQRCAIQCKIERINSFAIIIVIIAAAAAASGFSSRDADKDVSCSSNSSTLSTRKGDGYSIAMHHMCTSVCEYVPEIRRQQNPKNRK